MRAWRGFRHARSCGPPRAARDGRDDVVAVAIHLDDASLDVGAQVCSKILNATKINEGSRQEATQADVEDQAALDDFDNLAVDVLAGLELLLDADPSTLVLSTLLGEDQTTVLVLLLENQSLDVSPRATISAGLASLRMESSRTGNNALGLESDVNEYLVMLDLYDSAVDRSPSSKSVRVRPSVDHLVHLFVRRCGLGKSMTDVFLISISSVNCDFLGGAGHSALG